MSDCTQGSHPAHPQFVQYCLPNEEQIDKPKNAHIVHERQDSFKLKKTQWSKKLCTRLMRYGNIKKTKSNNNKH